MQFTFTAMKKNGASVSGTLEAIDRASAMQALTNQGLRPMLVTEAKVRRKFGLPKKVKSNELVMFTRQLSTMISAGVPLTRGLSTLKESANSPYFREVLGHVCKDVEGGTQLGDAFGKFPGVFDDIFVNMIRAGEEGGILDDILKRLATQVELNASINRKVKSAMMYPTVILTITVIAFFGIMLIIMPKMAAIMKDLGGEDAKMPIYTAVLMGASEFTVKYAFIIIPVFIAAVAALRWYIKTPKGKYQFHALLLKAPIAKLVVQKVAIARFSRTFASLMSAGVSVLDTLRVTSSAIGNKVFERELQAVAQEVKNGKQLSECIAASPLFPTIVSQMLAVGEETGTTDTVLIKVADFYEEEVAVTIDGLASIIEPVMIIGLGGGVGLIAASVMGTIAGMSSNIGE